MIIGFSGWENTGKTTLAKWLAKELSLMYVPEFAREYLDMRNEFASPNDWNRWICQLYVSTMYFAQSSVWDRVITDPYTYWLSLEMTGNFKSNSMIEDRSLNQLSYCLPRPHIVYDYVIYLEKEVPKPDNKKHVHFEQFQKEFIISSMISNLEYWRKKGSQIIILDTDSLEERKEILKREIIAQWKKK